MTSPTVALRSTVKHDPSQREQIEIIVKLDYVFTTDNVVYVLNTPVNLGRFGLCCLRKAIKLVNHVAQAKLPEIVHRHNNLTRSWR